MNDRIVIDPKICNGRPVIRGARITAQTILEFLAAGDSIDDVLREYPSRWLAKMCWLCIQYAATLMRDDQR